MKVCGCGNRHDPRGTLSASESSTLTHRRQKVQIDFSRPGKPTDNDFIETFNGSLRDECLNVDWFETIDEARIKIESWRINYNESRPHQGLNDLAPVEYTRKMASRTMDQSVINAGS
jgi:transposase InsO family protein